MGKAKLGVLLAGAYALGIAILVAVGLALPAGTFAGVRPALEAVPQQAQRAAQLARVAVHAGSLGMKHLPTVLSPQGVGSHRRNARFCNREDKGCCSLRGLPMPLGNAPQMGPILVRVLFNDDDAP